ncbi:SGNH/GDSL hydrolase family protein [Mesorhizobium sp. ASY16-5R]|uniref:SGNH/GDSL hydrolase family protein n=1 Tax=Mesorhizobium sp. ASY16-5R TaxID=3445772 RepID=UPI003F9F5F4B
MRARRPCSAHPHVLPVLLGAVALLAAGLSAQTTSAFAQEGTQPWSLRDLFAPHEPRHADPQTGASPSIVTIPAAKAPAARKSIILRDPQPDAVILPKAPDAKVVLVVGDFVAGGLAEGLNAIFSADPQVRIADRSNGSSGFVREDHFDWPGQVAAIIEAEKPAAIIVVIGANDRQQMRIGTTGRTLRSEAWTREYSARAANFASAVAQTNVPMVWVGTTSFKSPKASSDMLALNEIYRKVAADAGAQFIDVWEGFVDEKGTFATVGPDISGQPVRLRADDGISLTAAGKRKLAFYAEKTLKRLIGEGGGADPAPSAPAALPTVSAGPGLSAPTDRTMPVSLDDPKLDGGAELLGASVASGLVTRPTSRPLAVRGAATVTGRADDFSWPRSDAPAPSATPPPRSATATPPPGQQTPQAAN